jgi:hypothetical protein
MPRQKEPARDQRLEQLKAFGLFIRGEHTLYQIAEALGSAFVERNPSTAAGRARTRIDQGWRIICQRKVKRWERWWSEKYPQAAWQTLSGARLDTHPAALPAMEPAPLPELTPFERLLGKIEEAEAEARSGGFVQAAEGLRNMRAALRYQAENPAPAAKASPRRR